MKVLHVGAKNYPPAHGGTERVVYNIVHSISDIDFYLLVEWEQPQTERINVIPKNLGYFGRMKYILKYTRQNGIDIIHFHNEKYIPMAILLTFVFSKIVLTIHGVHFRSPQFSPILRVAFWMIDVLGTIFLPRMVHCNAHEAKVFGKFIFFRKNYFVNNGVPVEDNLESESDIEYKDKYVFLGRITPVKNLLALIAAADKRKIKVDIYGKIDDVRKKYCDQVLAAISKSEYAEYKGEVPYNQVFETIRKYKAFLNVSITEGLPLSVLEAASCGMYLILSKIPYHSTLNFPAVTYVDVKKPEIPYPDQITNGTENRQYVIDHFSIEKMGKEYRKIYHSFK